LIELHDSLGRVARELTAARDAWPQDLSPAPRKWWARIFPFQRGEPANTEIVNAARERLSAAVTGLQMTLRRVDRSLARHDLEPIPTENQPHDPETMEVLEAVAVNGRPPGRVIEEVRRGYRWRGRVFRCAQVRVAK
jgi:molecular chaperone GrpE